jgi:hypothetical protein
MLCYGMKSESMLMSILAIPCISKHCCLRVCARLVVRTLGVLNKRQAVSMVFQALKAHPKACKVTGWLAWSEDEYLPCCVYSFPLIPSVLNLFSESRKDLVQVQLSALLARLSLQNLVRLSGMDDLACIAVTCSGNLRTSERSTSLGTTAKVRSG